jgi:hypothetical protein
MAVPKLKKYLPDLWYARQRSYHDTYIEYTGQVVKHVRRSDVETNQYHDLVFANISVFDIKAVITRMAAVDNFMGTPLGLVQDNDIELFGYFKNSSGVFAGDLIVIELKSIEEVLKRFVYDVIVIKSWAYEQEVMRKYLLTPVRDFRVIMTYADEGLDDNPPTTEGGAPGTVERSRFDVLVNPGDFSVKPVDFDLYPLPPLPTVTQDMIDNPTVPTENAPDFPTGSSVYAHVSLEDHRIKKQYNEELMLSLKNKPPSNPFEEDIY